MITDPVEISGTANGPGYVYDYTAEHQTVVVRWCLVIDGNEEDLFMEIPLERFLTYLDSGQDEVREELSKNQLGQLLNITVSPDGFRFTRIVQKWTQEEIDEARKRAADFVAQLNWK